jgi:NADH dehydrogenase
VPRDPQGRVLVGADLSVPGRPEVFVVGDQAHCRPAGAERALPGVATVAIQQGIYVAQTILSDGAGSNRRPFVYRDKGQMAAIGRRRAVMQRGRFRSAGVFAWLMWLFVHIYFLSGFKNRLFVLLQWSWSYLTFSRGSRLIESRDWRSYPESPVALHPEAASAPEVLQRPTFTPSVMPSAPPDVDEDMRPTRLAHELRMAP